MTTSVYKCPVCDGSGLTIRPPWVAGGQPSWISASAGPFECTSCGGLGVIIVKESDELSIRPEAFNLHGVDYYAV